MGTPDYNDYKGHLIDACEKGFYAVLDKMLDGVKYPELAAPILREFKRNFQQMLIEKYPTGQPLLSSKMEPLSAKAEQNEPDLLDFGNVK